MYEKILAFIATATVVVGTIWFVCRRDSDRRASNGTESDSRRVGDNIAKAEAENSRLADAERRTRDTIESARAASRRTTELIESAGKDLERSQELVQKAKSILAGARHTD